MGGKRGACPVIFLLALIFLAGFPKSGMSKPIPDLLYELGQQRDKSEFAIITARQKFKDAPEKLDEANKLYTDVYSKGNNFIATMKYELTKHPVIYSFSEKGLEEILTPKAKDVSVAFQNLDKYVFKPKGGVDDALKFLDSIGKGAIAIWNMYKDDNEGLKKELDGYQWKPLKEIK